MAAVLVGAAGVLYLDHRIDAEVQRRVLENISQRYPQLNVSLYSARLADEGIQVHGLSLVDPAAQGAAAELAYFDEALLKCDTSWTELASGPPKIRGFELLRPRLRITRSEDGKWNVGKLAPTNTSPETHLSMSGKITGAQIEIIDSTQSPPSVLLLRDVRAEIRPVSPQGVEEAKPHVNDGDEHRDSPADTTAASAAGALEIAGVLSVGDFGQVEFQARVEPQSGRWRLQANAPRIALKADLLRRLPGECAGLADLLAGVSAEADVQCAMSFDPSRKQPLELRTAVRVTKGRIDDRRLPYAFTEVEGGLLFTQHGVTIDNLVVRNRRTTLTISGHRSGWGDRAPMQMAISGRNLVFDGRLREALPPELKRLWSKFAPEGEAHLDGEFIFDGQNWKPQFTITCLNVGIVYDAFPYPLERTTGTLTMRDGRLGVDLTAFARTDQIRISGEVQNPGPDATGAIQISAENIRISDELLAALDDDVERVVRSFQPSGTIDVLFRAWREPGAAAGLNNLRVTLRNVSARYEHFPYRLDNMVGRIEMLPDGVLRFHGLAAENDEAEISARGVFDRRLDGGTLTLDIDGTNVLLSRELKQALDADTQHVWDELQPKGEIDLSTRITYRAADRRLGLWVRFTPRGDGATIQPPRFPYRWEKLRGTFTFSNHGDKAVVFENVSAAHGEVRLRCNGRSEPLPQGGWKTRLENLSVDRLRPDRDLLAALPEGPRQFLLDLDLSGPINIAGWKDSPGGVLEFGRDADPEQPLWFRWNVGVYFHRNGVRPGIELTDIHGGVHLDGTHANGSLRCRGSLDLDSITWKNFQFTQVRGPMHLERGLLLLGDPNAKQLQPGKNAHLQAKLFGGAVYGDGWVTSGKDKQFALRGSLRQADLARIAQEAVPGRQSYTGRIDATLSLRGNRRGAASLLGDGKVYLTDANLYELPVILRLVKVISLAEPSKVAFTTGDIDYRIVADRFYLDSIRLNGDAVSLNGKGEIGFDRRVRLTFDPQIGRSSIYVPLVSDLVRGAGRQFNKLHVGGTLDDPEVRNEPFPALNQALQQIEGASRTPPARPLPPLAAPRRGTAR